MVRISGVKEGLFRALGQFLPSGVPHRWKWGLQLWKDTFWDWFQAKDLMDSKKGNIYPRTIVWTLYLGHVMMYTPNSNTQEGNPSVRPALATYWALTKKQNKSNKGWKYTSEVQSILSTHKSLGLTLNINNLNKEKKKARVSWLLPSYIGINTAFWLG